MSDSLSRRFAILPISVSIPVAVTTAVAVPLVIEHPEKTILVLSPRAAFSSITSAAFFSEGTDSPVNADSSLLRLADVINRASAGTKSPASILIISPGTSSDASITISLPLRITRACGADMFFRASNAFSALDSCITPIIALTITIRTINAGSNNSPQFCSIQITTNETIAAAIKIRIITSLN